MMTEMITMPLGMYQTNCYILWQEGSHRCLVIDPGYEPDTILRAMEERELTPEAILLTHGHFDHVGAVKDLVAETDCDVYLNPREESMPPAFTAGKLCYNHTYDEGDELTVAGMTFRVYATPGHTPGSVCLDFGDRMFTGDTLFSGSCGRTDLPGGNVSQMRESLHRLAGMDRDCSIFPGHGCSSTFAYEKKTNPFLGGSL